MQLIIDDNKIEYSIKEICEIYDEYYPTIERCNTLTSGIVQLTLADYDALPDILTDTIHQYQIEKNRVMQANYRKSPNA